MFRWLIQLEMIDTKTEHDITRLYITESLIRFCWSIQLEMIDTKTENDITMLHITGKV